MLYRDSDSTNLREVEDIHDFPTSILAHLERAQKEKEQCLVKAYGVEDDDTFKKFDHKKNFTRDLYNNVYCGDVAEIIHILPTKEYILLIADIAYGWINIR